MAEPAAKKAPLALDGVRVLALEVSVSGPHCSRILGIWAPKSSRLKSREPAT